MATDLNEAIESQLGSRTSSMRVILSGYYGFGNGGDEALLLSALQMLPSHVEPVVLSNAPQTTRNSYGIEAVDRWNLLAIIQLMQSADIFMWGGGSLLQDSTSWRNPLYYCGLMRLAQTLDLQTVAWAQGIGPIQRSWVASLSRNCLQRCTAISVRDRASSDLLSSWQISHQLAPDPVWALEDSSHPLHWSHPTTIGIVLRMHPQLTSDRLTIVLEALSSLQHATSAYIVAVPFQPSDRPLAQQVSNALTTDSQVVSLSNPRQIKAVFRSMSMAIAMRLHGVIAAAAAGIPTYCLSYDPKVTQVMGDVGLLGCELTQLPSDPEVLSKQWLNCLHGPGLPSDRLAQLKNQARTHADLLATVCV